jgi:DNA-binding transcriptional ArsR family regulator
MRTDHNVSKRSRSLGSFAASRHAEADNRIYEMQVRICKAFANSNRLRILDLLGKKAHTVSGLQKKLGIPLANVSVQLAILRATGLVVTEKKGKQVWCSLPLCDIKRARNSLRLILKVQTRNAQSLSI